MLFNSFQFILFFILVTVVYYCLPQKMRWVLLLGASYYFYMCWRVELIVLIIFSTFANYLLSLLIYREKDKRQKRRYLIISLIINFGLLFFFKYALFFNDTIVSLYGAGSHIWYSLTGSGQATVQKVQGLKDFDIILPMGISFYTFQAASYTIDVYKRKIKPIRHYGIFSLFISFFPQLVAGPIERSENLLPQFFQKHSFDKERVLQGCKIMALGYFKKIVSADRVAIAVNTVYNSVESYNGLYLVLATLLFTFQIYCDFSGYSDIAMGSARVLGFDLMQNFKKPYFACSIKEFWRRWHVSLSTWFMDYVYIPLGGNRDGKAKQCCNLMTTFLVSGLWHGANWTFVLWGGIHGVYQVFGILTEKIRNRFWKKIHLQKSILRSVLGWGLTFLLVAFGWIFFRANSISDGFYVVRHLLWDVSSWGDAQYLYHMVTEIGLNLYELKMVGNAILILMVAEFYSGSVSVFDHWEGKPYLLRLGFYVLIGSIIVMAGVYDSAGEFIYFQF